MRRWLPLVDLAPLAIGVWLLARLVQVWVARLAYPYDLEWMEGGMLVHAWRLEHGLPLYPAPGPSWIPFIYPPGYPALLAFMGQIFGLNAETGRGLSIAATLIASLGIVFVVARHGRSLALGVLGAMVFLGCYPAAGAFYDLVRNDAVFVALLGWAIALGAERRRGMVEVAGLLLCAAFLVKHNAAVLGLPMLVGIGFRDGWRAAARFAVASIVPALLVVGWLQWRTDGRFLTYLLAVPAAHPMVSYRIFPGTPWELGAALPVALPVASAWLGYRLLRELPAPVAAVVAGVATLAGVLGIENLLIAAVPGIGIIGPVGSFAGFAAIAGAITAVVARLPARGLSGDRVYGIGVSSTMLLVVALMRGHHGGFLNVHIPMYWLCSVAFALALARWREQVGPAAFVIGAVLLCLQLGFSFRRLDERLLEPTRRDRAVCDELVAKISGLPEPVLSPYAPWLPVLAGKAPSFHLISLWDVEQHVGTPFPEIRGEMRRAVADRYWGAVLDADPGMGYGVRQAYTHSEPLPGDFRDCLPKTGWRSRPRVVLERP